MGFCRRNPLINPLVIFLQRDDDDDDDDFMAWLLAFGDDQGLAGM